MGPGWTIGATNAIRLPPCVRNVSVPTPTRPGTEIEVKNASISSRPSSPSSVMCASVYRISVSPLIPNALWSGRFAISVKPTAVARKIPNTTAAVSQSPSVVGTNAARPRRPRTGWTIAAGGGRGELLWPPPGRKPPRGPRSRGGARRGPRTRTRPGAGRPTRTRRLGVGPSGGTRRTRRTRGSGGPSAAGAGRRTGGPRSGSCPRARPGRSSPLQAPSRLLHRRDDVPEGRRALRPLHDRARDEDVRARPRNRPRLGGRADPAPRDQRDRDRRLHRLHHGGGGRGRAAPPPP